jgi:hypothetical protein
MSFWRLRHWAFQVILDGTVGRVANAVEIP